MKRLAHIDLTNFTGLATKVSQDVSQDTSLQVAKNTDFFELLGAISKSPGSARVLSSIYTENGQAKRMSWHGLYKAPDLDGQILRHILVAGGTKLHRLETNGTLTALTGAGKPISETRRDGLFHSADQYFDFLLIQNQDPDLVGIGDTPVKYDGAEIHKWGITPPGNEETLIDGFDNLSNYSFVGGSGSIDTTTTQDGTSLKVTATSSSFSISRTNVTAFAVDNTIPDRARISVYIPRAQIVNFDEGTGSPAISIRVGTNVTTNYHQFNFDRGELIEGWQNLFLDFSSPDSTVGSPGVSALTAFRIIINSASGTALAQNIRFDRLIVFDRGTPIPAEGGTGTNFSSGDIYSYKVTYGSKYGHVSNAGPASIDLTLSASRSTINLTGIPVSSDSQVISRTLWRTVGNGALHLFLATINNNTDTTYSDTTADVGLGDTSPPFEGDVSDDNSVPPKAAIVKRWKDTIFLAGLPDRPEVIAWSDQNEPESFPTLNEAQLDGKLTAIYETYSGLVIETETGKWQVTGENPDFRFDKIISNIGCVGRRAAGQTRIVGYAIDREGMRLYDLNNPTKISEIIRDKFDSFNKVNIELIHSAHSKNRNLIVMCVPNSNGEYKGNNFIYQYPVDDVYKGWWWELDLPDSINPLHIQEIEDTNGDFKLYMGCDDGMIYELFKTGTRNWELVNGSTEAVTMQFRTKYFRAADNPETGEEFTGRIQPRMLELRYSGDTDNTFTALVETANSNSQDTALDSTTITFLFRQSEGLLRLPINAIQPGEYVRITITNSESSKNGIITGMRLSYQPRPGNFGISSTEMNPSLAQITE